MKYDTKLKIGIITYDVPHKKTQNVVNGLIKKGYLNIRFIINKFKPFKKRNVLFNHRPNQIKGLNYSSFCKKYHFKSTSLNKVNCYSNLDLVLICGSGIITNNKIERRLLINCHSGLIPETRGLDSFKWAIYKNKLVGNTLHFIDHKPDLGKIISQSKTSLLQKDDLYLFSRRHYMEEINMLVNFEENIKNKNIIKLNKNKPTMRMPIKIERKMIEKFDNWKSKFIKIQND